jgi:hypothetical protein
VRVYMSGLFSCYGCRFVNNIADKGGAINVFGQSRNSPAKLYVQGSSFVLNAAVRPPTAHTLLCSSRAESSQFRV